MATARADARRNRRFAGASVRTRIAVAVALLVGLALAGAGLVVYALESARIARTTAAQVEQEVAEFRELRDTASRPGGTASFRGVAGLIRTFLTQNVPEENELLVGYWDGGPRMTQGNSHQRLVYDPAFRRLVASRIDTGGTESLDSRWGEVTVTVQPAADGVTRGALVIANFLEDEHAELRATMQTYAIVSMLSAGLITAAAAWQAGRLLSPLRTLRENAREITETDLSRRIPETGNDDITALTRTFNQMLARLETAFTGQRQFLDDAGHELKTPLTVIRGHMELLECGDPADVEETKALLLDETDRMSRLVDDLLVLAKADRPDFVRPTPVDVAPFTRTVLEKCRALGDRAWTLDEHADIRTRFDEQRITQALLQLAKNAVTHTVDGSVVGVGSQVGARGLTLWVRDEGPGVSESAKSAIFDRFHRASDGHRDDEGFGLGLSIVRAIALGHGGTVTVEDAVPRGAKFVMQLPVRTGEGKWHGS